MAYHKAMARANDVNFACQLFRISFFILFANQEFAESAAEVFDVKIPFDYPILTNGNLPGFFGDDDDDRIGLFRQSEPSAVAEAQISIQVLALGEWKNAGRGDDAIIVKDQASIVQDRLRLENRQDDFFGERAVDIHAGIGERAQIDFAFDRH